MFPADDTLRGDIPDPDISAFPDAFDDAYITPLADTGNNNSATPWHYNFDSSTLDLDPYAAKYAGTTGGTDFWVAYIIGLYETLYDTLDNDPENERCVPAESTGLEPEYSYIYHETIRDMAAQFSWNAAQKTHVLQFAALHEIGHQFNLPHEGGADKNTHAMWKGSTDAEEDKYKNVPLLFKDIDLRDIRNCTNP